LRFGDLMFKLDDRELRNNILREAFKDQPVKIKAYPRFSVAYSKGVYVVLDIYRYIYVIKPLTISKCKPKFLDRVYGFRVPLSIFRPPFTYGALLVPKVGGGRLIEEHNIRGWQVYAFKGTFKLQDPDGNWVEGKCIGFFAFILEWDAIDIKDAIKKLIELLDKVDFRWRYSEIYRTH